MAMVN